MFPNLILSLLKKKKLGRCKTDNHYTVQYGHYSDFKVSVKIFLNINDTPSSFSVAIFCVCIFFFFFFLHCAIVECLLLPLLLTYYYFYLTIYSENFFSHFILFSELILFISKSLKKKIRIINITGD